MKFLLVDDHVLIRQALRSVLIELDREALVLEAATSTAAVNALADAPDTDLVLLDIQLPDEDGLNLLARLRANYPAVAVVMLSGFNDRDNVITALNAGAVGFITKSASRDVLINALRLILSGGVYIPPEILERTKPSNPAAFRTLIEGQKNPTPSDLGLTERQVQVLGLMMQGKSNKLICRALQLAEPTVKNHVSAILKALNVVNRTEAVLVVADLGWQISTRGAGDQLER